MSEPPRPAGPDPTVKLPVGGAAEAPTRVDGTSGPTQEVKLPATGALPEIPDVVIQTEIGRGGMGIVFKGRQPYLERTVAVKVLPPALTLSGGEQFVERFRREARILAGLGHPNIVACYQAGTTPKGECFLVMEFVDGPNLREWIEKNGKLAEGPALEIVRDLALALEHARASGIIHRDVKPENVLLAKREKVAEGQFPFTAKLVDLGLARRPTEGGSDGRITTQGVVVGTPATMAPEQFDDPEHVDFKADIYGLGCVVYHALTGKAAFAERAISTLIARKLDDPPNPQERNPEVSEGASKLVRDMLAPSRDARPPSYEALIERTEELLVQAVAQGQIVAFRRRTTGLLQSDRVNKIVADAAAADAAQAPSKTSKVVPAIAALVVLVGGFFLVKPLLKPSADPAPPSVPPPAPPRPPAPPALPPPRPVASLAWGPQMPLFKTDYTTRYTGTGWRVVGPPAFQSADDGGVEATGRGLLVKDLAPPPWRVEGSLLLQPRANGSGGVRFELEDGSAAGLDASFVNVTLAKLVVFRPDDFKSGIAPEVKASASFPAGAVKGKPDELWFTLTAVGKHLKLDVGQGSTWKTVGELDVAVPVKGVGIYGNGKPQDTVSFRNMVERRPEN